jgi:hypothetical protein
VCGVWYMMCGAWCVVRGASRPVGFNLFTLAFILILIPNLSLVSAPS